MTCKLIRVRCLVVGLICNLDLIIGHEQVTDLWAVGSKNEIQRAQTRGDKMDKEVKAASRYLLLEARLWRIQVVWTKNLKWLKCCSM